jgi:L-aminopeptidase/D-esterase-like protein
VTRLPGVQVGHWTGAGTGVTVVLCPRETVGSVEVRGGAPAERETALLHPTRAVEHVDAVVLSGGSAFGLAAADGVVSWLAERGRGFPTRGGPVPIVPAAAIYDLVTSGGDRPGRDEGRSAADAALRTGAIARGRVGAGTGATVGKWRGAEHAVPGGLGVAMAEVEDARIGALAVVNAIGDVVDAGGRILAGSSAPADVPGFADPDAEYHLAVESTTLVVISTDARCTKAECHLLAQSGHHGLAQAVRPSHTRYDGDIVIALATGPVEAHFDRLRVAAADVVAEAVRDAVRQT